MDALTKKLLLQLDDPMPGVYIAAVERAREHMAKVQETFRGFVQEIEEAQAAKKRASDLEEIVRDQNTLLQQKDALIQQYIATLKKAELRYIYSQKVLAWI